MIAVARVSVNHDGRGGTAPDPLIWDQGGRRKVRKTDIRVNVDLASPWPSWLLGWAGSWIISGADVAAWPCSVGILCKFTASFGTLHWPVGSEDMGHFGVSFLELLILFEQWAGHRLLSKKVTRPHARANRLIFLPSVPVSEGIEIRHGCQFISSLVRALAKLPGGIGRFLPCRVGSHMSRLRHLGLKISVLMGSRLDPWNPVIISTSRLFVGFGVSQTISFRHCTTIFTMRFPPPPSSSHSPLPSLHGLYSLPRVGNGGGKRWFVTLGHLLDHRSNVVERVRLTRKTRPGASSHVIPDPGHPTPRRWKRLRPPSSE